MSAIPDLAYPETEGSRPTDLDETLLRQAALYQLAAADSDLHQRVMEAHHFIQPLSKLRSPSLEARLSKEMERMRWETTNAT
jgi:hypothetical protein